MTTEEILLTAFRALLLLALVICAIATAVSKRPMTAVIIFTSYSIVMSILWLLLESPDLAITEAAVGAGITGILFYLTLHRLHRIQRDHDQIPDRPKTPAEPSADERKGAEEQ
jgi:uncharacterized MnhB-related membrane protein